MRDELMHKLLGTAAVMSMLGLPGAAIAAMAGTASDVHTRTVEAQTDLGRAGVESYWQQREPRDLPGPVANLVEKLETSIAQPTHTDHGVEFYGRAGRPDGLEWASHG
jgi:hypothetical protein